MPEGKQDLQPQLKFRTSKRPGIQTLVNYERNRIHNRNIKMGLRKPDIETDDEKYLRDVEENQNARDIVTTDIKATRREQEKNHIDVVTGIYTRAGFLENVHREIGKMEADIKRGITRKAVLFFLDADELKKINTEGGHAEGDKLLRNIAEVITNASRTGTKKQIIDEDTKRNQRDERALDICGRWGGDEFVIFVSDAGIDDISPFWNKLNKLFNERNIKISAGAAEVDINNLFESIDQADMTMLAAKQIGKQTGENTMIRYDQLDTAK